MVPRNTLFGDKILRHALFLCNGSDVFHADLPTNSSEDPHFFVLLSSARETQTTDDTGIGAEHGYSLPVSITTYNVLA
jgi:hypothetical protein